MDEYKEKKQSISEICFDSDERQKRKTLIDNWRVFVFISNDNLEKEILVVVDLLSTCVSLLADDDHQLGKFFVRKTFVRRKNKIDNRERIEWDLKSS